MLRVLTCALNGRASITRARCATPVLRGQNSFKQPGPLVPYHWSRDPLADEVPIRANQASIIRFTNASLLPLPARASFVARCSSWIPDSGTQDPAFCRCSNFLSLSRSLFLGLFLFILLESERRDRSLELLKREKERWRRGEILQITIGTISTPADLLARITTCHRLFCLDGSARMNRSERSSSLFLSSRANASYVTSGSWG